MRIVRSCALLVFSAFLVGSGCGGDGGPPNAEDGAPPFTSSYGNYAYVFFQGNGNAAPTSIAVYSDGSHAAFIVEPHNGLGSSTTARIVFKVSSPSLLEAESGQVNLDADASFANNDLVDAVGSAGLDSAGLTLATGDGGIDVGSDIHATYRFVAGIREVIPLDCCAPGPTERELLFGAGFPPL